MKSILVVGCKASGKSSVAKHLAEKIGFFFVDGAVPIENTWNSSVIDGFVSAQKEYIKNMINMMETYQKNGDSIVLSRGPENVYSYTLLHPLLKKKRWNISSILFSELTKLRECFSDVIIMLDVTEEEIRRRSTKDCKKRYHMDEWIDFWFLYEKEFFETFPNLLKIESTNLSIIETVEIAEKGLKERNII